MQIALYAGELLIRNGAEMYRAEETIMRISEAGGIHDITPFVTPTILFIANGDGENVLYTRNIKKRSNNIAKITLVSDFSRKFETGHIDISEAMDCLRQIDEYKGYPYRFLLFATGIGCGVFAVLVGGKFGDFVAAFFASYIAVFISDKIMARSRTVFTGNFVASMFVGVISILSFEIKLVDNLDNIIVGAALALVPGVAFTAGIRDFISGDLLSGIARIGEAVLVAIAIAFGVGSILMLYSILGGL
ncbi:threonine/serine exporter family protein [Treponema vincentii]|nr:threonine/serine exporter family protein [Treponema vincentii]